MPGPNQTNLLPTPNSQKLSEHIEDNFDAMRKELGVEDGLKDIPGVTTLMLVSLGEHGIKTIGDLADCATDDLDGWNEIKNGKTIKHAGILDHFRVSRQACEAMIMTARTKACCRPRGLARLACRPPRRPHRDLARLPQEARRRALRHARRGGRGGALLRLDRRSPAPHRRPQPRPALHARASRRASGRRATRTASSGSRARGAWRRPAWPPSRPPRPTARGTR